MLNICSMKKILTYCSLFIFALGSAQNVGINTTNPQSTLDITGLPADPTKADGVIAPRLTLNQLNAKVASYGINQTGSFVYITDVNDVNVGSTLKVESIGYYYFDGTTWKSLEPKAGSVIFTATIGNGIGGNLAETIPAGGFNTVSLPNVSKNLGGGTWDSGANTYTVPVSGTYLIKSSVRLLDGSEPRNIFQAVNDANVDTPEGIWQTNYTLPTGTRRWTMLYNRVAFFDKGDQLRLYIYSDLLPAQLSDASLNITILSPN